MTIGFESRTLGIYIQRPLDEVYRFIKIPENFPKWASGLGHAITLINGEWVVETPQGLIRVRFSEHNEWGVADHTVILETGRELYVPMRVVSNGTGSEVVFTLFRLPDMSDEQFVEDIEKVEQDLKALKRVLES